MKDYFIGLDIGTESVGCLGLQNHQILNYINYKLENMC